MFDPDSKSILQRYVAIGISSGLVLVFAVVTLISSLAVLLLLPGLSGPVMVEAARQQPTE